MPNSTKTWNSDPLTWGKGPCTLEAFLEPTCPFSARAFPKLFELIERVGADLVTVKIRLHSQPWHIFSGLITRAIIAASTTKGGKEAARAVMAAVFAKREEFEFENHCAGPNMDATPNQILARIEKESCIAVAEPFRIPDLDREIMWHTKYARQNGIHVSPTFMIGGLINSNMSSGDAVDAWAKIVKGM
jgi:hypothetical protein